MHDIRHEYRRKHLKISPIFLQTLKLCIHITRVPLLLVISTLNTQNHKSSLNHFQDSEQGPGMRYQLPLWRKPKNLFKTKLQEALLDVLQQHDDYLDISQSKAVKNLMDK